MSSAVPPQFNSEMIYKIWHLEAEKPILGLYSERDLGTCQSIQKPNKSDDVDMAERDRD